MIRLTKETDYALVLLSTLGKAEEGCVRTARELADQTRMPVPIVGKVLKVLSRHGLLKSHRGAKGGYGMSRPAAEVNVGQVIEAMEGPIALTDCCEGGPLGCQHEVRCPVTVNLRRISRAVSTALAGITIADLSGGPVPVEIHRGTEPPIARSDIQAGVGAAG